MSLNFASIAPHPPIIIPEIGKENVDYLKSTISSMKKIADHFSKLEIDTSIFISPHAELSSFAMTVCEPALYSGDFADFGYKELKIVSSSDNKIASMIISKSKKAKIPIISQTNGVLDHGVTVPLYYFQKHTDYRFDLVEVGYSNLSIDEHVIFGEVIGETIRESDKRIALVISGDLSHRHLDNYYKKYADEFDQEIINIVSSGDLSDIKNIDPELIELAGECGYRSLLIASGVLKSFNIKLKLLSYEKPFGVGYLVAGSI